MGPRRNYEDTKQDLSREKNVLDYFVSFAACEQQRPRRAGFTAAVVAAASVSTGILQQHKSTFHFFVSIFSWVRFIAKVG